MKKLITITLCMALIITLFTGCAEKQIPVLTGKWKQSNSKVEGSYQEATINGDVIEIYHISNNGDTKALYWVGSFINPTTSDEPYKWTSENDHSKTDKSLRGSNADTKVMTYENGIISYEHSIIDIISNIKLEKQK